MKYLIITRTKLFYTSGGCRSSAPSEIFIPERTHYARTGFDVVLVPVDRASSSYDSARQVLSLAARPDAPTNSRGLVGINVAIRPRRSASTWKRVDWVQRRRVFN